MKTDPPHILCVNPWIHDFAAFDFWAKPLGLLLLAAILRENRVRVSLLDLTDRFHPGRKQPAKTGWDGRGPFDKTPIPLPPAMAAPLSGLDRTFYRYGISKDQAVKDLQKMTRPDLVLVTSLMTYWASGVAETITLIKETLPGVPVVLGGIYATLCEDHARSCSGAHEVVTGPGEAHLPRIVENYTGFRLPFMPDPADLDTYPHAALDLLHGLTFAPLLTTRGCPFHCDYCASSFLEPTLRRRSPSRVFEEILGWHKNFRVVNFPFYDDALLVDAPSHAHPLFERIIAERLDLNFHTPNALHIREISAKTADLMYRAGFKTVRLGLESADFDPDQRHDAKVKEGEFLRAVRHLKEAGFRQGQLGAYLLCGLPGQDLGQVARSMDQVRSQGVTPVLAYYTPIPHTPMWDQAVAAARIEITAHPGLTNNSLFPCVRSPEDRARILQLKIGAK